MEEEKHYFNRILPVLNKSKLALKWSKCEEYYVSDEMRRAETWICLSGLKIFMHLEDNMTTILRECMLRKCYGSGNLEFIFARTKQ